VAQATHLIDWKETAEQDLADIALYYTEHVNTSFSLEMIADMVAQIESLCIFPLRTRIGRVEGTREYVIAKYRYIAVIRVTESTVEVHNVIHTSRQYPFVSPAG
jgi:toxin ParE1/3/4